MQLQSCCRKAIHQMRRAMRSGGRRSYGPLMVEVRCLLRCCLLQGRVWMPQTTMAARLYCMQRFAAMNMRRVRCWQRAPMHARTTRTAAAPQTFDLKSGLPGGRVARA